MRRRFSAKQKAQIVLEILKEEKTIAQIASEFSIHSNQLHRWKKEALDNFHGLFEKNSRQTRAQEAVHQKQLDELYAEIGRLTTQVNWLKKKSGLDLFEK